MLSSKCQYKVKPQLISCLTHEKIHYVKQEGKKHKHEICELFVLII